jgi:hypothetical protein
MCHVSSRSIGVARFFRGAGIPLECHQRRVQNKHAGMETNIIGLAGLQDVSLGRWVILSAG